MSAQGAVDQRFGGAEVAGRVEQPRDLVAIDVGGHLAVLGEDLAERPSGRERLLGRGLDEVVGGVAAARRGCGSR